MDRLEAFEKMLAAVKAQAGREAEQMAQLKAAGKEKSATYRQLVGNRLFYKQLLDLYQKYDLND